MATTSLALIHATETASAAVDTFIEHLNAWAGDTGEDPGPYKWLATFADRPRHLSLLSCVVAECNWWGVPDYAGVYRIARAQFQRVLEG